MPGQEGLGDGVPQKLKHFLKYRYTTWNLRPGENGRHNLMPLVAFFYCCAHQHCVVSVSCCTMFGILAPLPPAPQIRPCDLPSSRILQRSWHDTLQCSRWAETPIGARHQVTFVWQIRRCRVEKWLMTGSKSYY